MIQAISWSSDQELGSCGSVPIVLGQCKIQIGRMVGILSVICLFVCWLVFCQLVCAEFGIWGQDDPGGQLV